jgi:hypothetical protein
MASGTDAIHGSASTNDGAPSLPSDRAFVVQFRRHDAVASPRWDGRAEHVSSGRAGRFESWEELRAFIEGVLASQGPNHATTGRSSSTDDG